jgi:hypothetical protein
LYRKNQDEFDEIDQDQTLHECLKLKQKFFHSKAGARDIIGMAKRQIREAPDRNMLTAPGTSYSDIVYNEVALPKIQLPSISGS